MSKSKEKSNNKKPIINKRTGVIFVSLLAVIILVINLLTLSYSWYEPQSVTGKGIYFNKNTNLRSENCSFSTYVGTVVDDPEEGFIGEIRYSESATTGSVSIPACDVVAGETVPGRKYFRTNILNSSREYPSVVSLFLASMPANLTVCVTFPSNSVRAVGSTAKSDYYLIRNAYVKKYETTDADGPGLLQVDWFVENYTNSAISLNIGTPSAGDGLYLMYN